LLNYSAHAQVVAYNGAIAKGVPPREALVTMVDGLVAAFTDGI